MKKIFVVALLVLFIVLFFAKYMPARKLFSEIDYQHFNGAIFRILNRDNGGFKSDKVLYKRVLSNFDFRWLIEKPQFVAHALGGSGNFANTSSAFLASIESGLKFYEVDIRLDEGIIYCEHDQPFSKRNASNKCSLEWMARRAKEEDIWFILDVKTDFVPTYKKIYTELRALNTRKRFIPQLYIFEQIRYIDPALFAGPIFTGYRQNQSAAALLATAEDLGVPAITLSPRYAAVAAPSKSVYIFTHGVQSVKLISKLSASGVSGFYVKSAVYEKIVIECVNRPILSLCKR